MDIHSGIFTAPFAGIYLFLLHIATHDNKKALLSIRKNGEEIASVFDQNHKDNHKNSMAGQNLLVDCQRGDEVKKALKNVLSRCKGGGVRLHWHLVGRLPDEPLHPLGWHPAQAQPARGKEPSHKDFRFNLVDNSLPGRPT